MKKILIAIFMVFLFPFAYAIEMNTSSTNIESQYADLYVSVLKYEPFPAGPGEYFDLWLEIENKGLEDAENVEFVLQPQYPFSIDASEKYERNIALILSHSSALVRYRVRVDENAIEGESLVHYSYSINSKKPVEGQVSVLIQTLKAILSVENVKTTPDVVAPGEIAEIEITLKNNADSYLKYITASLQLLYSSMGSQTATSTGSYVELPFTPFGGGNEKSIYQLAPHKETTFNFRIVADPDSEVKPYKIPISIEYFDEIGKNYTKLEIVGIVVGSSPDIYSIIDSSEISGKGSSGEIQIRFVNKGTSPVKFLNVQLQESEDYKIISSSQEYIGKIDSDDYDTATFRIYLKSADKKIEIPIKYEFMDGNNKEYSTEDTLILELYSSKELGKGSGGAGIIVLAIIIIIIAYLIYRRWRKKRKRK